jgi:serine/threonine protein kinase
MGCGAVSARNGDSGAPNGVLSLNKIYERKELIGSGTYGKVYRCVNKLNSL